MKDSEILRGAIDQIERHGWIQGEAGSPDKGMCAIGALAYAANVTETGGIHAIEQAMVALTNVVGRGVVAFNDDPSTSSEDVLLALKQAAVNREAVGA
jgi:hypothetical protein